MDTKPLRILLEPRGARLALSLSMGITFKVHKKNGDYIRASVVPGNHADEPHFGLVDATIVAVFLLGAAGLIYLLTLS